MRKPTKSFQLFVLIGCSAYHRLSLIKMMLLSSICNRITAHSVLCVFAFSVMLHQKTFCHNYELPEYSLELVAGHSLLDKNDAYRGTAKYGFYYDAHRLLHLDYKQLYIHRQNLHKTDRHAFTLGYRKMTSTYHILGMYGVFTLERGFYIKKIDADSVKYAKSIWVAKICGVEMLTSHFHSAINCYFKQTSIDRKWQKTVKGILFGGPKDIDLTVKFLRLSKNFLPAVTLSISGAVSGKIEYVLSPQWTCSLVAGVHNIIDHEKKWEVSMQVAYQDFHPATYVSQDYPKLSSRLLYMPMYTR